MTLFQYLIRQVNVRLLYNIICRWTHRAHQFLSLSRYHPSLWSVRAVVVKLTENAKTPKLSAFRLRAVQRPEKGKEKRESNKTINKKIPKTNADREDGEGDEKRREREFDRTVKKGFSHSLAFPFFFRALALGSSGVEETVMPWP